MLKASLKKQKKQNFELIVVDTIKQHYNSAAEALNYGAQKAKGDVLVFIHHDIDILDERFIDKVEKFAEEYDFGIAGVCGVLNTNKYKVISSVLMGLERVQAGTYDQDVQEVYSLDECLLIVKADTFKCFSNLGSTWHFYGVDYSIMCHNNGQNVLYVPLDIYHLSPGWSLDYSYFDTLLVMGRKYAEEKTIKTCMGVFRNNSLLPIYCLYRKFKLFIKKLGVKIFR